MALQDLQTLGIVADADDDFPGAGEARVNDLLLLEKDRVFTSLKDFDVYNRWIDEPRNRIGDSVRVGVWIMPDNESEGALEEFAMDLVPEDNELWDYSDVVIEGLTELGRCNGLRRKDKTIRSKKKRCPEPRGGEGGTRLRAS